MNDTQPLGYPPGVPRAIPVLSYSSLGDLLTSRCEQYASETAFVQDVATLTYGELRDFGERLAAFLTGYLHVTPGDRVALMMPNSLSYPVAICGTFWSGCVGVNVNPMYTPREVRHQLLDSGARAVIVAEPFANTVRDALADAKGVFVITAPISGSIAPDPAAEMDGFQASLSAALSAKYPFEKRERSLSDTALLQYTGGTTGPSKGAELTHRNILSNVKQLSLWLNTAMARSPDVVLTALPIYHIFAFTVNVLSFIQLGAKNVLISNPRNLDNVVETMEREGCTVITGVNTFFSGLLNTSRFSGLDFSKLRLSVGGGSAIQPAVARRWQDVTGSVLVEGFGMSETSPVLTINRVDVKEFRSGIGLPLPSTELSIRDEEGREVPRGESGELYVRGPQVMRGYWNKPEENARAFASDGYFRTGDVAYQDAEGYFHIVDRKKDMVLVSGFNVYPNEVEAICAECPGVLESACVGVPDDKTGEAVKIYVVRQDDSVTRESLSTHFRLNLAAYKVPRHIEFVAQLPKSPVGKILRRELRG